MTARFAPVPIVVLLVLWLGKALPFLPEALTPVGLAAHVGLLGLCLAAAVRETSPGGAFGTWSSRWIAVGVGAGVVLFAVMSVGYVVAARVPGLDPPAELDLLSHGGRLGLALVLAVALLAAVLEEWLFRGVLAHRLAALPPGAAIFLGALAFAAYHLDLAQLLPTFLLGLGLGLIAHRSGSLWPAVIAHMTVNLMGVLLQALARSGAG